MKHNNTILLLLFVAAISLYTCKTDPFNCEGEDLGNITFDGETLLFFPYDGSERLIYRDSANVEISLTCTSPSNLRAPVNVEKLCESFDKNTYYKYYSSDAIRYIYRSQDGLFNIEFQVTTVSPELRGAQDTAFLDVVSTIFFTGTIGASASVISSERNNSDKFTDAIRSDYSFHRVVGDTTINGRALTGLYEGKRFLGAQAGNKTSIFVKKGAPAAVIVESNGRTWVLDRVE
jgi:hypothetical protein